MNNSTQHILNISLLHVAYGEEMCKLSRYILEFSSSSIIGTNCSEKWSGDYHCIEDYRVCHNNPIIYWHHSLSRWFLVGPWKNVILLLVSISSKENIGKISHPKNIGPLDQTNEISRINYSGKISFTLEYTGWVFDFSIQSGWEDTVCWKFMKIIYFLLYLV